MLLRGLGLAAEGIATASKTKKRKFDLAQYELGLCLHNVSMAKPAAKNDPEWLPIKDAPFNRDLELAVIDYAGVHALIFPCRRVLRGWTKAQTEKPIDVTPTHWRAWTA